jgi:hypothetical protein
MFTGDQINGSRQMVDVLHLRGCQSLAWLHNRTQINTVPEYESREFGAVSRGKSASGVVKQGWFVRSTSVFYHRQGKRIRASKPSSKQVAQPSSKVSDRQLRQPA